MPKLFQRSKAPLEITVSNRTVLRVILLCAGALLLYWMITVSARSLTWIGIALFLALALNGPVRWLERHLPSKKRDNRSLATSISVGMVLVFFIGFLAAIVPPLARQTVTFAQAVPGIVRDVRDQNTPVGSFVRKYKLESQVERFSSQLSSRLDDVGSSALSTIGRIGSSLVATLTVLVLTVMMLVEGPRWYRLTKQVIPREHHARFNKLMHDMTKVVQGYVNGQVLLAAIASALIVPVLFIVGVQYPLALMVVVFICGLIPMVGHTIGAVICTVVALFTSLPAALIVLGYYILYQQVENYAVQPRVQANSTNMSPLLVFVSVVLGANFGGLLGALVAIPVAGCARVLLLDYLERRNILSPQEVHDVKTPGGDI
jgi:predicted PurR-regulated permease PerM